MKKATIFFLSALFWNTIEYSQPCLPEGIYFGCQEEIDNFQYNYPGCSEIEGNVTISTIPPCIITNLDGLSVLNSIGGDLIIGMNPYLLGLSGLDNITSIGGDFRFNANHIVNDFEGLGSLTNIGGSFIVGEYSMGGTGNQNINNFSGLGNLISIGGDFVVWYNYSLENLAGFDNLNSIAGKLEFRWNDELQNFNGLESLSSVGEIITISSNEVLTSLAGLENINLETIEELTISDNPLLTDCNIENICGFLDNPTGSITIYDNAIGCDNPIEVANACGITLDCLPFGNYNFNTQAYIDNFQSNFPNCFDLQGNVYIGGDDIVNLNPLNSITSIGGDLTFFSNPSLINLTGLNNVTSIGGILHFYHNDSIINLNGLENLQTVGGGASFFENNSLTNFSGLNNLSSIGGQLLIYGNGELTHLTGLENVSYIGGRLIIEHNINLINLAELGNITSVGGQLMINGNDKLNNLSGLENITSISGALWIIENDMLLSLQGLENINANSIDDLKIYNNSSLSTCEVLSVCSYLANPTGEIYFNNNAYGCDTQQQVEDACEAVTINENNVKCEVSIYPNPASNVIFIQANSSVIITDLNIYNTTGQIILKEKQPFDKIDISRLYPGLYFIEVVSDEIIIKEKLIVN